MTTIIITGITGAGKTTLANKLANYLNYTFIDLDLYIEKTKNLTISNIIKKYGIKKFRSFEQQVLINILKQKHNKIIALGGGTFNNLKNQQLCNKYAQTIWLNPNPNIIINNYLTKAEILKRPLLTNNPKQTFFYLYNNRLKHYKKAKYVLEYNNITDINILVKNAIQLINKNA